MENQTFLNRLKENFLLFVEIGLIIVSLVVVPAILIGCVLTIIAALVTCVNNPGLVAGLVSLVLAVLCVIIVTIAEHWVDNE